MLQAGREGVMKEFQTEEVLVDGVAVFVEDRAVDGKSGSLASSENVAAVG